MNHIIDGHNLIGKTTGLSLSMPDDEDRLVELLMSFCNAGGHRVEVYFDGAPVGQSGVRNHGRVRAYFIPYSQTADDAIRKRVADLGRAARNWLVVTSDRSVQKAAREAHAEVMTAEKFAHRMQDIAHLGEPNPKPSGDIPLSEAELREWEAIFKGKNKPKQP